MNMENGKIQTIQSTTVTLRNLYLVTWGERYEVVAAEHHDCALRKIVPAESVLHTQFITKRDTGDVVEYVVEHPALSLENARKHNSSTCVTGYTVRPLRTIR